MNLQVPLNAGNFLISRGTASFSGRTLFHGVGESAIRVTSGLVVTDVST